jgi:hypothetical protein|tara:strand:- start:1584 stop:1757 length:174 start_codon:yes stop_codon:yes gene_type:complete
VAVVDIIKVAAVVPVDIGHQCQKDLEVLAHLQNLKFQLLPEVFQHHFQLQLVVAVVL